MAKRKRVLVLEFPGEPGEQELRDVLGFVQAKLTAAGAEAELIVLTKGVRLREILAPAAKSGPTVSRDEFAAMSEQMYEALTGAKA